MRYPSFSGTVNRRSIFNSWYRMFGLLLLAIAMTSFTLSASAAEGANAPDDAQLIEILEKFKKANFRQKGGVVLELSAYASANTDERVLTILETMLAGRLYFEKKADNFVELVRKGGVYTATNLLTDETVADVKKRAYKKVGVNNFLRRVLRAVLAGMQLKSSDLDTRLKAARALLKSKDQANLALIDSALSSEVNPKAQNLLSVAKAMLVARYGDPAERVTAVQRLEGELYPEVRSLLAELVLLDAQGQSTEPDAAVRDAAQTALASIEDLITLNKGLENIYFGVSLGAVLLLAAVGLAITFGVMGVINMAHGEMIMLGAYTTFVVQQLMPQHIEYSLFVAIPAAFLVSGLVGMMIERGVIRFLYGRPLETLLATFGLSLILQQTVRSIFGPLNQSVITPEWMSGTLEVNGALLLTYNRLYIIIFSLLVLLALALLLKKTFFGLQMRAVTQNRAMASSMGIRTGWLDALTFGLGSGIAGIAGVALSQLTNVGPNLGQAYIIDSFMVVVFGGVGNLVGTFVGAMSLGIANKLLEPYSGAVLAKILVLIFIILFIQKYPRGMFALKGRAAED